MLVLWWVNLVWILICQVISSCDGNKTWSWADPMIFIVEVIQVEQRRWTLKFCFIDKGSYIYTLPCHIKLGNEVWCTYLFLESNMRNWPPLTVMYSWRGLMKSSITQRSISCGVAWVSFLILVMFIQGGGLCLRLQIHPQKLLEADQSGAIGGQFKSANRGMRPCRYFRFTFPYLFLQSILTECPNLFL